MTCHWCRFPSILKDCNFLHPHGKAAQLSFNCLILKECTTVTQNIRNYSTNNTAPHSRTLKSSVRVSNFANSAYTHLIHVMLQPIPRKGCHTIMDRFRTVYSKYTPHNKPEQLNSQSNTFHLYSENAPFTTQLRCRLRQMFQF